MNTRLRSSTFSLASLWASLREDKLGLFFLIGTLALLVALWLLVRFSFDTLPDVLPLHFDVQGQPDRIGERQELYTIPTIAMLIAVFNIGLGLLLRVRFQQRFSAYLLWAGAMLAQVLFWIATWNIIR